MTGSTKTTVLVVDDEPAMRELLEDLLGSAGYAVTAVADGKAMHAALHRHAFALVILDLRLHGEDGLALARELRSQSAIPIMMLTGKGNETDRIVGLEIAADDFLMKPFNNRELLARVRAMLRRATELSHPAAREDDDYGHERYRFGDWVVDLTSRVLYDREGRPLSLTRAEFTLLEAMVRMPNHVLSREQLLEKTRGCEGDVFDRTIDVLILRLRRKIEINPKNPQFIRTERGIGYSFSARVTQC